jgi:hypothetical protein
MQLLTAFTEMDKTGAPLAVLERTAAGLAEDVEMARSREVERFRVCLRSFF